MLLAAVTLSSFLVYKLLISNKTKVQYQTQKVQKGILVTSISTSGQVISSSSLPITTQLSGIVDQVFVQNGDTVSAGQKIASLTLDQTSQQKQAAAWSSYLQAKNQLDTASANLNTLQNLEFSANQKFINDAVARGLVVSDPTYIQENASWLAAEANYKNQQGVIIQAQAALNSAWKAYQQLSSVISAPASGVINDLLITPGYLVSQSSSSSNTSLPRLGSVVMEGPLQASVNLSELDITQIKIGQKVSLTLDAFPNKTFSGKVFGIDTSGVVSSGVTNYPVTVTLDNNLPNIYPNMAVSAQIITSSKADVLTVPNQALQNQNGQTLVRVLKNNQPEEVPVETGLASETETEIVSGLTEGDEVITEVVSSNQGNTNSSPFGGGLRFGGGFGGGGALRPGGFGAGARGR